MYQDSPELSLKLIVRTAWYFKRQILLVGIIAGLIFASLTYVLFPDSYESSTNIKVNSRQWEEIINTEASPKEKSPVSVAFMKSELLSKGNIETVISDIRKDEKPKTNFLTAMMENWGFKRKPPSEDAMILGLQFMIKVDTTESFLPSETPDRYTIKLQSDDPDEASDITRGLIVLYSKEKSKAMKDYFNKNIQAIKDQLEVLTLKASSSEETLVRFIQSNASVPLLQRDVVASLTEARKSLSDVTFLITELQTKKQRLEALLAQEPPTLTNYIEGASTIKPPDQILKEDKAELAKLQAAYTDSHPDIQRLKREIAYYTNNPDTIDTSGNHSKYRSNTSPNPEYQHIRAELATIDAGLARAISQKEGLDKLINITQSKSGETTIVASFIKEQGSLLDQLNLMKANLQIKLTTLEIRKGFLESGLIPYIDTLENTVAHKSPPKPRYMLILVGGLAGLLFGIITALVRSYLFLSYLQESYGPIKITPDALKVSLIETTYNKETKAYEKRYVLYLPESDSDSNSLVQSSGDICQIKLYEKSKNSLKRWWFYPAIATGYLGLFGWITIEFVNQFFIIK